MSRKAPQYPPKELVESFHKILHKNGQVSRLKSSYVMKKDDREVFHLLLGYFVNAISTELYVDCCMFNPKNRK